MCQHAQHTSIPVKLALEPLYSGLPRRTKACARYLRNPCTYAELVLIKDPLVMEIVCLSLHVQETINAAHNHAVRQLKACQHQSEKHKRWLYCEATSVMMCYTRDTITRLALTAQSASIADAALSVKVRCSHQLALNRGLGGKGIACIVPA